MERMHIGELNDSFPPMIDGVAQVVKNYADHLHDRCDVTVVTPKYQGVQDHYPYEVYRYPSIPMEKWFGYRVGNPFDPKTLIHLRAKSFDLMHVHAPFASSVLAAAIDPMHTVPLVLTYHTKFEYDFEKRLHYAGMQHVAMKFMLENIRRADEVWAVTDGCGKALQNIGYDGAYYVMENGTDFPVGRASDDAVAALRAKYGIPDDAFVFLFVGRMMWYKNVRIILDAMKHLKNRGLPYRCLLVGSGMDLTDMQTYAANAGIADRCVFTGPIYDREALRAYYSMADLFLFPSTFDTSGIVVKEAAACGCPSLLVRDSCAAEGATHGVNAFITEENGEDAAAVLWDACQSRDTLKTVGQGAARDLYLSWETAVDRAYKRYGEILKSWPGDRPPHAHHH